MKSKEVIVNFVKKFNVETIAVLAFSFISAILFDMDKRPSKLFEVLCVIAFAAMGTFLVDKIFDIYEDVIREKIRRKSSLDSDEILKKKTFIAKAFLYIIAILIQYLLFLLLFRLLIASNTIKWFMDRSDEYIAAMSNSASIIALMSASLISYFVVKNKKISVKDYLLEVFINYLFVFLVECVVLAGILILYFICEVLLGGIPYYVISRIIVFMISIITTMGFFISIEKASSAHSLFSKILVRYIMQVMVFIGFVIFYIYFIKIIVKHKLPSNQVFLVCTILFSIGLLTSLMSLCFDEDTAKGEKNIYAKAVKFLPIAFIPALILQIISIVLRINQYGLTAERQIGVMLIIFEIVYLVYYILDEILKNKKVKIENVFLPLCLIIAITFLIPKINAYEFPKLYNKVFKKEVELNENKVENEVPKITYREKNYRYVKDYEIDIKGFDKMKYYGIVLVYDTDQRKYKYGDYYSDKEVYNLEFDFTGIINEIKENIEKKGVDDAFENINNSVLNGNKKIVINYVSMRYDEKIGEIVNFTANGFLFIKE